MLLPFIIFVAVSGAIIGGYFAAAQLPGILAARRLDRRLRDVSTDSAAADPNAPPDETVLKHALEGPLPGHGSAGVGHRRRQAHRPPDRTVRACARRRARSR